MPINFLNLWRQSLSDSGHPTIKTLFANLDRWRHFAGFPLEARVDALIGLFLPKVLEDHCGVGELHPHVIPQFPLKKAGNNQSDKVDFFAMSKSGDRAYLVEVKTDMDSLRLEQHEYLSKVRKRGLARILSEFKKITVASRSRKKYFHLINALSVMGLLSLPEELKQMMRRGETRGSTRLIQDIEVLDSIESKIEVVFVQPHKHEVDRQNGFHHIYFDEFANRIESAGELGCLLAGYLRRWETGPGCCPPSELT